MKKIILFVALLHLLGGAGVGFAQNIGINATGASPAASAGFDIDFTNKGLLIPRVALTATNAAGPITAPATSLFVYNTATAGVSPNNVLPGYYYWDGASWVALGGSGGKDWSLLGNAGTVAPASAIGSAVTNNFIGTTDAIDFAIATNGLERFRIKTDNNTQLRIGAGTSFTVNLNTGSTPSLFHLHDWGTTANDFAQLNLSSATVTSGNRTGVINFAATAATNERRAASIESYLTAASGTNVTGDMRFFTNNNNTFTEKMRIEAVGNVGIGITNPAAKLDVGTTASCCATQLPTLGISELTSSNSRLPWIQFHAGGFQEAFFRLASSSRTLEIGDAQNVGVELAIMNNAATTRNVVISGKSISYFMGGNVGIGTTTPGYRLDLNTGTFAFGNGNVRTESRDNAGLQGNAGAQSGFFETASPTNYPTGASSWWHLIDVRHSNNGNNYAMQLSGSFFDQKIYFRKTNNNAAQPWQELLSSANNPVSVSLAADYTVTAAAWTTVAPMTVTFTATKTTALVQFSSSGFAYTNSMAYVQFRVWNSTTGVSMGGTNTHMQSYDDVTGTITPWSCTFTKNITGLIPGTSYTLVVQGQRGGIWGTLDAVINASSMPDMHHMTLTVLP
jgi:hypothetical protein